MHILYFNCHLSTDRKLADNFIEDLIKIRQVVIKTEINNINQTDTLLSIILTKIIPEFVHSVKHVQFGHSQETKHIDEQLLIE